MNRRYTTSRQRTLLAGTSGAALLCCLLPSGCGERAPTAAPLPGLPPLRLQPLLPTLKDLAARAAVTPAPAGDSSRELRDYADVALQLAAADAHTAAMAERHLLAHPDAGRVLVPALQNELPAVRRRAAWLLGRTGRAILQFPLLLRLKDENDPDAALWIADALHRLGNDSGLGWLDAAMDVDRTAQRAGQLSVELLAEDGAEPAAEPTWGELQAALRQRMRVWRATGIGTRDGVAAPDPDAVAAVLAAHLVATEGTALRPVDEARFVLVRSGVLALPLLVRALSATESYLRTMSLQVLAELGPAAHGTGPAILPLLGDPLTASYAMRALGEVGCAESAPHLRARLQSVDTELRAAAVAALGLLRDEASAAPIAAMLADAGEAMDVRVQAAFARLCLGDDPAAEAFLAERERVGDYHAPTLARLRDKLAEARR